MQTRVSTDYKNTKTSKVYLEYDEARPNYNN